MAGQFEHMVGANFVHLVVVTTVAMAFLCGHLLVHRMARRAR